MTRRILAASLVTALACGGATTSATVSGELCVSTVPSSAAVTVDGAPLVGCATFEGVEGRALAVSVSAPGYTSREQSVLLGETMPALTIELVPEAKARQPRHPPPT
jgi:hypothetical protein